jgi:hypothetical protein
MNRLPYLVLALLFAGCGKNIDNNDAVRQGVVDYLNKRTKETGLDMNLMNVEVTSVTFSKNEARAMVSFKPKGSDAPGGMSMGYTLERQGDKWVVRGRQESGLNPHGGEAMPLPGGAPVEMPRDHPPVEGAKPESK